MATIEGGREGRRFRVEAGRYVLAMGGIETARLLLLSNQGRSRPLGNASVLGRFFMVHPLFTNAGTVTFRERLPERVRQLYSNQTLVPLATDERVSFLASHPVPPEDPRQEPPPFALLGEGVAATDCRIYEPPFTCRVPSERRYVKMWCVMRPTGAALGDALGNFRIILRSGDGVRFSIDVNWEQVPNPASQVLLSATPPPGPGGCRPRAP